MPDVSRRELLKYAAGLAAIAIPKSLCTAEPTLGPYADAVFVDGEPPAPASESFTIVVLPDTQNYCMSYPEQYLAQTEWIIRNREKRNIACVLHLGDITENNTSREWEVAVKAMCRLDGFVPYFMAVGNHDYHDDDHESQDFYTRTATKFNEYFPLARYCDLPTFGGTYDREPERLENSYHLFSAGGREFLVIALEFGPRNDVLRWAGDVATKYKNRETILITHAYMYYDDTRYDWCKYGRKQLWNPHSVPIAKAAGGDVNDGEEIWTKLVSTHDNFILVLSGHVLGDGLGRRVTRTPSGRKVPQMLVNFQMKPNGGDGWMRLLEFRADRQTVEVFDYSPTRKQWNESLQNRFSLNLIPVKS